MAMNTTKARQQKQDWSRFDAMTDDERHKAALADPDAQQLADQDFKRK